MKPLDIVRTPKGAYALIIETGDGGVDAAISYFGGGNPTGERNAWWSEGEGLVVVDNLPHLLSCATANPFGRGKADAEKFFPILLDNNPES